MPNQTVSNDASADDDALGLGRKFAHVLPLIENSLVMYTRYISDKRLSITGTVDAGVGPAGFDELFVLPYFGYVPAGNI